MFVDVARKIPATSRATVTGKRRLLATIFGLTGAAGAVILMMLALQSGWASASAQMADANTDIEQARAWSHYNSTADDTATINLDFSRRYTALTTYDAFSAVMVMAMAFSIGLPLLLAATLIVGTATARLAGHAVTARHPNAHSQ